MPHQLFLLARQKTKKRNAFTNNMLTEIKLSKSQLVKIIQTGGYLGKTLRNVIDNLGKKALIDLAVPLAKLATKATLPVLDKFERK